MPRFEVYIALDFEFSQYEQEADLSKTGSIMEQRPGRLAGKVALVTGAGSSGPGVGTGKATSILFAREGAKVLLVDRVAAHAEETLATIHDEGGEASIYEADITQAGACQAMVEAAVERYGGLHILMNNVGIAALGTVIDVTEEDWDW